MQILKTIRQQDFDPSAPTINSADFFKRQAARAVVFDQQGAVALLHVTKHNYYKLPGGGIEQGEDISVALGRELLEEIGCTATITGELGQIVEYRDFWQMVQTSFCFKAQITGQKGQPSFTQEENDDGFEVVWVPSLADAIALVKNVQPAPGEIEVHFMRLRDLTFLQAALPRD